MCITNIMPSHHDNFVEQIEELTIEVEGQISRAMEKESNPQNIFERKRKQWSRIRDERVCNNHLVTS